MSQLGDLTPEARQAFPRYIQLPDFSLRALVSEAVLLSGVHPREFCWLHTSGVWPRWL